MPNKKESLSIMTVKTLLAVIIFAGIGTIIIGGGWLIEMHNKISEPVKIVQKEDEKVVEEEIKNEIKEETAQNILFLSPKEAEQWKIGETHTIEINQPIKDFYPFTHLTLNKSNGDKVGIISCKIGTRKRDNEKLTFNWDTKTVLNYCGVGSKEKNEEIEPGIYKIALTKDIKGRPIIAISESFLIVNSVSNENNFISDKIGIEEDVAFDGCGKLRKYEKENWYNNFVSIIGKIDRLNYYEAKKLYDMNKQYGNYNSVEDVILKFGKVSPENISDACLSTNNKYFLAIVAGQYGGSGFKLLRFDIEDSKIAIAKREDIDGGKETAWYKKMDENYPESQREEMYLWFVTPSEFDKKEGSKIIMTGRSGDAGCLSENTFEYDLKQNYISVIKGCSWCEGDSEKRCTFY